MGSRFPGCSGEALRCCCSPQPPPPWGLGRRGGCGVAHSHGAAGWGRKGGLGLGAGEWGPGFATAGLRPPASSRPPATHRSHGGGGDTSLPVTRFPPPSVTHGTPAGGGGAHGGCPKPWDGRSRLHEAVPAPGQEPGPGRHQRGPALGGLWCWGGGIQHHRSAPGHPAPAWVYPDPCPVLSRTPPQPRCPPRWWHTVGGVSRSVATAPPGPAMGSRRWPSRPLRAAVCFMPPRAPQQRAAFEQQRDANSSGVGGVFLFFPETKFSPRGCPVHLRSF